MRETLKIEELATIANHYNPPEPMAYTFAPYVGRVSMFAAIRHKYTLAGEWKDREFLEDIMGMFIQGTARDTYSRPREESCIALHEGRKLRPDQLNPELARRSERVQLALWAIKHRIPVATNEISYEDQFAQLLQTCSASEAMTYVLARVVPEHPDMGQGSALEDFMRGIFDWFKPFMPALRTGTFSMNTFRGKFEEMTGAPFNPKQPDNDFMLEQTGNYMIGPYTPMKRVSLNCNTIRDIGHARIIKDLIARDLNVFDVSSWHHIIGIAPTIARLARYTSNEYGVHPTRIAVIDEMTIERHRDH